MFSKVDRGIGGWVKSPKECRTPSNIGISKKWSVTFSTPLWNWTRSGPKSTYGGHFGGGGDFADSRILAPVTRLTTDQTYWMGARMSVKPFVSSSWISWIPEWLKSKWNPYVWAISTMIRKILFLKTQGLCSIDVVFLLWLNFREVKWAFITMKVSVLSQDLLMITYDLKLIPNSSSTSAGAVRMLAIWYHFVINVKQL